MSQALKNPIHPSILPKLDPEYVTFHNAHLAHLTLPHQLPAWDARLRNAPAVPGGSDPLPVGRVRDFEIGADIGKIQLSDIEETGDVPSNTEKTRRRIVTPGIWGDGDLGAHEDSGATDVNAYGEWNYVGVKLGIGRYANTRRAPRSGPLFVRTYTLEGTPPPAGWPAFLFFHGGGWTMGTISSEASFCTNMCVRANCVVISVHYRLAPENPYPAAAEDAVDALWWIAARGHRELGLDVGRVAIGGSSSGGNLAATLATKAGVIKLQLAQQFKLKHDDSAPTSEAWRAAHSFLHDLHIPLQLLIVPVTDNTADVSSRWAENQHAPWLSPERMLWFRRNYLPRSKFSHQDNGPVIAHEAKDDDDALKWDSSPLFTPRALLESLSSPSTQGLFPRKAWFCLAQCDILCDEGQAYADLLEGLGKDVQVEVKVYEGAPHTIRAMDGVLAVGRRLASDAAEALKAALA